MGVSYSTYVGVYIDVKPNKTINVESSVYGCEKCKTESSSNFCSKCGSPKTKWERSQKIKLTHGYEIFNFVLKQMDVSDEEHDSYCDKLHSLEYSPVIVSNETYFCKHLYNNEDERFVIDFDETKTKVKEFEAKHEEFLAVMRKNNLEFNVVYGVIATTS